MSNNLNPLPHNNDTSPPIYPICEIEQGALIMMPKPRGTSLQADMAYYKSQGISHIVCLLRQNEMDAHGLGEEGHASENAGLGFSHFPVQDMDVPEMSALQAFNAELLPKIKAGETVAIHCHGGRGRAGTMIISLMLEAGYALDEALAVARKGRGDPLVPVCQRQDDFLVEYAQQLANNK